MDRNAAENTISIIYFEDTDAFKRSIDICNDTDWYHLIGIQIIALDLSVMSDLACPLVSHVCYLDKYYLAT